MGVATPARHGLFKVADRATTSLVRWKQSPYWFKGPMWEELGAAEFNGSTAKLRTARCEIVIGNPIAVSPVTGAAESNVTDHGGGVI